jgi:hypothetical protein
MARYRRVKRKIPAIASVLHLNARRLTYVDYCRTIYEWLRTNAR